MARGKIQKPMSFRMTKRQGREGLLPGEGCDDGIDFTPKPEEIPGILAYWERLEAQAKEKGESDGQSKMSMRRQGDNNDKVNRK